LVTQDGRDSLTAFVSVSAFAILFYAGLQIQHRYPQPRWLSETLRGLNLALLLLFVARAGWRRWRRGRAR
jgi:hypothetical protein